GEAHVDARIDLRLLDAVEVVRDRVLDGKDVRGVRIEPPERRVERGRLARTGRPGNQHDAMRLVYQLVEGDQGAGAHAELAEVEPPGLLVEQSQDRALAVTGGQGRYADVDWAATDAQGDTAILRQALLGDVELRHDLDPGDQRCVQLAPRPHHVAQGAVDPEADQRIPFERLDMDVGRAIATRLCEQRVDHPDDRGVVLRLEEILDLGDVLHQPREVQVARHFVGDAGGTALLRGVGTGDRGGEFLGRLLDRDQAQRQCPGEL